MSKQIFTAQVLNELYSGKRWRISTSGGDISLSDIIKEDDFDIDEDLVNQKIQEKINIEPMKRLREERNRRIEETDWRFRTDLTPSQEWIDYSQALRDLPSTASPQLDDNGQLTNVTWPTKPE